MIITTKKTDCGQWQVVINRKPTRLVIDKSFAPRFGGKQLWCIGRQRANDVVWLASGIESRAGAVDAIRQIVEASNVTE